MSTIFPPHKKFWRKGTYQVGLFVRFPDGTVSESEFSPISPEGLEHVKALIPDIFTLAEAPQQTVLRKCHPKPKSPPKPSRDNWDEDRDGDPDPGHP